MWPFERRLRLIRSALKNKNLQKALERASNHHQQQYEKITTALLLDEIKAKARTIKEDCLANLPVLIKEFIEKAKEAGATVHLATKAEEALFKVKEIIDQHQAKLILKTKSMVSEEIGLNQFLEKQDLQVVETDLGEWIVQLARERPSHITAPALHKTKEEIASLLSHHLGKPVRPDPQEITRVAREYMRPLFLQADIGISGANLAIAESGTLVILSNEGNDRLVTSLPPIHIAIITVEKIVSTMEQAVTLIKALVAASSGRRLTSYVSFITGPSSTTDIEKEQVIGTHGPRELHIILLDNGRMALTEDKDYQEILMCLKCGGCMLVCPVFKALGGHIFGGPVYPGGIGLLLTFMTRSAEEVAALLSLCADCKKCEAFCPVGIHSGELITRLKNDLGPSWGEKILSSLMQAKQLQDSILPLINRLQKIWSDNDNLKPLPFKWTKGKKFPLLRTRRPEKTAQLTEVQLKGKPKVYLFEGCLNRWFFPEIAEKSINWLMESGYQPLLPLDQVCCGAPSFHLGDKEGLKSLLHQNLNSWKKENPEIILTFCPTGHHLFTKIYPEIEPEARIWRQKTYDVVSFLEKPNQFSLSLSPNLPQPAFYHPPCHLLASGIKLTDRIDLFQRAGLKVHFEGIEPACCGFCGVFSFKHPEVAACLWARKKEKIFTCLPEVIITECPGCLFQLRSGLASEGKKIKIYHLAEIINVSLSQEKSFPLTAD